MRDRISRTGEMARFWPPRASRAWQFLLTPMHKFFLHRHHAVSEVNVEGMQTLSAIDARDGILICPNHSYTGDGSVMMEVGRRSPRTLHIMAAWHVFRGHWGLDGFFLQRFGAFSVDREGTDRRAIRMATELLTTGKALVIFPEGEIYHLNERLTPLREGVAFVAATAQRELEKSGSPARVWIVPAAIRYEFADDIRPRVEESVAKLESRVLLRPPAGATLHERIVRVGEILLTIKEKERLGKAFDGDGETLPGRLNRLINTLLERLEREHLNKTRGDEPVPVRVKLLRQHLLEKLGEGNDAARAALDDVHLVLQLYSYPGNYLAAKPTIERMAETIEKFEEDISGRYVAPVGRRRATVRFGGPIDVKQHLGAGRARGAAAELTARLETAMTQLMCS